MNRIDSKGMQRRTAFQSKIQNPKSKIRLHPILEPTPFSALNGLYCGANRTQTGAGMAISFPVGVRAPVSGLIWNVTTLSVS